MREMRCARAGMPVLAPPSLLLCRTSNPDLLCTTHLPCYLLGPDFLDRWLMRLRQTIPLLPCSLSREQHEVGGACQMPRGH
jgi:hypothetical protein